MKYILYILAFFCLLIGGGAWFFYNHPVGLLGVLAALYILWRQEKKPRPLALKLGDGKGKNRVSSQDQADFAKALRDFNAMEGERRSLTDPELLKTVANMQHVARNFLYYLQQYPDRIPIASHFINYYQDRAVYMIRKYKKLAMTGLKTEKVTTSQKRLKQLLCQLDEAYEEQFTQVLDAELTDVDGETTLMAHHLEADGIYDDRRQRKTSRSSASSLKGSFSRWKKEAADRFDAYTDGTFSSITPELRHKINEERLITAFLAFFLGTFGIHHFYPAKPLRGVACLCFCWTLVPTFLGLRDGIRCYDMTTDEFYYACYLPKYRKF